MKAPQYLEAASDATVRSMKIDFPPTRKDRSPSDEAHAREHAKWT